MLRQVTSGEAMLDNIWTVSGTLGKILQV